jgi:VWFA-related protein
MPEKGKRPIRRFVLLALLASFASTAEAAKRVTVAQLQQALTTAHDAHKSDAEVAHEIGGFELSERLSEASLNKLVASLDGQATLALQLLADQSAFLDPPANEVPSTAAPDDAAQQHMIAAGRKYVAQTLLQLPNLFATQTTNRYDDGAYEAKKGGWPVRAGLHLVNTSSQDSSIFNERGNSSTNASSTNLQQGLSSGGEFGSTLSMILSDTVNGKIAWSHWEQTPTGPVAVFHYLVPSSASHFEVINSLPRQGTLDVAQASRSGRQGAGINVRSTGGPQTSTVVTRPGYHGALWVEPGTGTILRTTMEADTKGSVQFKRAAIMVQYGPVQIGESTFICPVRSVALSAAVNGANLDPLTRMPGDGPTLWLNESVFSGYHRFGIETRIVQNTSAPQPPQAVAAQPNRPPEVSPPASADSVPQTKEVPEETRQANVTASHAVLADNAGPPPVLLDAPSVREVVPPAQNPQDAPFKLVLNVNRAMVPVVVRDKQGHLVADLKKEDFQVFERGKPQTIVELIVEKREVTESAPASNGNGAAVTAPQAPVLPKRITLYLFDDLHLSPDELAYLKKTDANAIEGAVVDTDMADVASTSGKVNSGLTRDRAKLHDAIVSLQPRSIFTSSAGECPKIEYYQADLIEEKHDSTAFANALAQVFACDPALNRQRDLELAQGMVESAARRSLMIGEQDTHVSLATIKEYVRRMAKLPGQRTLVLVSPGFLSIAQEDLSWESQIMDLAVQSGVTINALDARGLYTGVTDISEWGGGQIIDPVKLASMTRAGGVMSELAYGTGGSFFHNSNDLAAGFKSLTDAPELVYVLELSLDGVKPDGAYHRVNVKVDREGMQIQARQGYSAPKQEKDKK